MYGGRHHHGESILLCPLETNVVSIFLIVVIVGRMEQGLERTKSHETLSKNGK
jgi:hypothetical protein